MFAFNYAPNHKNLTVLFIAAFLVRAITFQTYIQHNERYKQPDSMDYHNSALSITVGTGMHRPDTLKPIFWRTPGYPLFLSFFYSWFGVRSSQFATNRPAQVTALWVQIILASLIPLLIFALINMLTGILSIAWITAWISVFHLGMVLASTYFLTESLALLFFFPFLIFFYKNFKIWGEKKEKQATPWAKNIMLAALFLGLMAWIRPMGEFVSIIAVLLIITLGQASWKIKGKKIALFFFIFFMVTGGWYLRNYQLTGKLFFCPMFGPYLNSFCAPKIVRDTTHLTLSQSIGALYRKAKERAQKDEIIAHRHGRVGCRELAGIPVALPIIKAYPWIFMRDWMKEVLKTTFDLHASLLVGFARNTFMYDPLEEFLTEKLCDSLYKQPMPLFMRLITFLEVLFQLLKWIGLLLGAWLFLFSPLLKRFDVSAAIKKNGLLWLKVSPMIGAIIFMTGGFGYARLRLPVDPFMIMLSLTFWYWALNNRKKGKKNEKTIRAMAQ